MAIITSYFEGESYGLLGPQMAATVIEDTTSFNCIVIAVTHSDDKTILKKALYEWFGDKRPIVGFSCLSGRKDLFDFARDLKADGAVTILAGPQSGVDYLGETGWQANPHHFHGLSKYFSLALQGPAEQIVPVLNGIDTGQWQQTAGILFTDDDGRMAQTPGLSWNRLYLGRVRWNNLYQVRPEGLTELGITTGQVLQHIGCPHAAQSKWIEVDYPTHLDSGKEKKIGLELNGCSFCDVASDKGFCGTLDWETVFSQIKCLPAGSDGRKIGFELINENALPGLPRLIQECHERNMPLSRIQLTLRADWFLNHQMQMRDALRLARKHRIQIQLSSIGFESFDDRILKNLNKGLTVQRNLDAILLMRRLKTEFPFQLIYSNRDGSSHGLIHPTPWDNSETDANIQEIIEMYGLSHDILPAHSIPLIIHHNSGLAQWIRQIEQRENVRFERFISVIGWWPEALISNG